MIQNKFLSIIAFSLLLPAILMGQSIDRPKLVVGIVVDQMRPDYLTRYNDRFVEDGFKKLINKGYNYKNMHYNYMPTYTAPGHSSIYTGATPVTHGIVGNSWFHKMENEDVYCTYDPTMSCVGSDFDVEAGKMSPFRLKATSITDALKLETNSRGKVFGVSIKDRGAILPVGHFADQAFWMNDNGEFISSSFYSDTLPKYVTSYNQQKNTDKYLNQGWDLLFPVNTYTASLPDDNPYERIFKPKTSPTFPYDLAAIAEKEGDKAIIKSTPYGNQMVVDLAKEILEKEKLGKDNFTDFLAISFSSTDYAGHSFSPRAIEVEDMYLRLDRQIADLIKHLDKQVGEGNYLLFLTADHAAAENPKFLSDKGYKVENLDRRAIGNSIKEFISETFSPEVFVNYSNQNIFLNEEYIRKNELDYTEITRAVKGYLEKQKYVSQVYTRENILQANADNLHLSMIAHGYDSKQNGDLVILLDPQYIEYYETGTTHGSTYSYDTHVPLLWYGWNIPQGESVRKVEITEIAPTISHLISVPLPNGSEGVVLKELFEN